MEPTYPVRIQLFWDAMRSLFWGSEKSPAVGFVAFESSALAYRVRRMGWISLCEGRLEDQASGWEPGRDGEQMSLAALWVELILGLSNESVAACVRRMRFVLVVSGSFDGRSGPYSVCSR